MARARSVRQLKCPRCGAPLTWKGDVNVVECRYCQTHVVVESGQRTQAPAGAVAHKPLPMAVWIAVGGGTMFLVALLSMVAFVNASRGSATGAGKKATPAEVAAAPLNSTPEQMAQHFGVQIYRGTVHVDLDHPLFDRAHFSWDENHLEHVSGLTLSSIEDKIAPDLVERIKAQLGRVFRGASTGGYQYNGHRVNLGYNTSNVGVHAHTFDDPRWKERFAALWTVLKGAALGTQDRLDDASKRNILNIDNPLMRINDIRFDIDVDGAEREVKRVIPGAVSRKEHHSVGLNHPWFESAGLSWENAEGGRWSGVNLSYPKEFDFKAQRSELERCLEPVMGEPKVHVRDHMAGDVYLTYDPKKGLPYLTVTDQMLMMSLRDQRDPTTRRGLHRLVKALSKCP